MANALAHTVWKLNAYQTIVNKELVNLENIVYHVLKRYTKEFVRAKRSYFQRVTQKDEAASTHFLGLVAGINNLKGASEAVEVLVSDGFYTLKAVLKRNGGDSGDDKLISLIEEKKIYPGIKLHFVNQTLSEVQQVDPLKQSSFVKQATTHHFLAQSDRLLIGLNFNGIWRAKTHERLGQHPTAYTPRCLKNVV